VWINVEDKLPEENVNVLVCDGGNSGYSPAMYVGAHNCTIDAVGKKTSSWHEAAEYNTIFSVTHWMPLPAPPE
jgi:hypothetical protein